MTGTPEELHGKVALVTGASRGIGAEAAVALAAAGCDVACAARSTRAAPGRAAGTLDDTAARVEQAGRRALSIPVDLRDERATADMVDAVVDGFGRIDILVNNAAVWPPGEAGSISLKHFDLSLDLNLRSPFVSAQRAAGHMARTGGGRILNISSGAAMMPVPGMVAYGPAKLALELLTLYLAADLHADGIAVNSLRIDVPCLSSGYNTNVEGLDVSNWEPADLAADAVVWLLRRDPDYTGRRVGLRELRDELRVVASRVPRPDLHPRFPDNVIADIRDQVDLSSVGRPGPTRG